MAEQAGSLATALADRYRLERELGQGGMATVYLARDLKHDRDVALKVLRPDLAAVLGGERFLREIRITARLQHPHILPLLDSGAANAFLYYVMPYVEGESLRGRLEREPQLPLEAALALARQVASALDCAHQQGIVHRDIKPENILLSKGEAVVADFGIALAVRAAAGERLTETGLSLGTPQYMSPEQATGSRSVDARSDVYSLGAVLYEMLVGEPPHTGATVEVVLAKLLTAEPVAPRAVRRAVPEPVNRAVLKALAKQPLDRFASAGEFAAALAAPVEAAALEKSIVVLPFENLSPDPDNAFFADGLTEELIADLSKVRALRVISRTSAMHFKGTTKQLPEIARELNVRYVLEGSVRRAASSLRITAQLIDAASDAHLWAEKYAGTFDDVFDMQEKVSRAIVDALQVHLSPNEDRRLAARPLPNAAAYECYLRAAREIMRFEPEGLVRGRAYLEQAVGMVGEHATLLAGLAMVDAQALQLGYAGEEALTRAREFADKALALDPDLPEAHAGRGLVALVSNNWPLALHHYRRAVAGNPADVASRAWLAEALVVFGNKEASLRQMEECLRLDPFNPMWRFWSGVPHVFTGDMEAAMPSVESGVESIAGVPLVLFFHAYILAWLGRRTEALRKLDALPPETGPDPFLTSGHLLRAALLGDAPAVDALLEGESNESRKWDAQGSHFVADFHALVGRHDETLEWLERAVDGGWVPVAMFERDPFLAPLRDDPRWERLMARARLAQASVPDEP